MTEAAAPATAAASWKDAVFGALKTAAVTQRQDVPDAGKARVIALAEADPSIRSVHVHL